MKYFQTLTLLFFILFSCLNLYGQDATAEQKKEPARNLHVALSPFSSISYDQKIIGSRKLDHSLNVGVQASMLTDFDLLRFNFTNIFRFNLYAVGLLGKGNNFVELGLGQGVAIGTGRPELRVEYDARMFLGYRRKFESALFRVGLGFPEILYVGGGIRF